MRKWKSLLTMNTRAGAYIIDFTLREGKSTCFISDDVRGVPYHIKLLSLMCAIYCIRHVSRAILIYVKPDSITEIIFQK